MTYDAIYNVVKRLFGVLFVVFCILFGIFSFDFLLHADVFGTIGFFVVIFIAILFYISDVYCVEDDSRS